MTAATTDVGHPGGGMTYARFFPSDWRTGCLVLNLEEEGLYIRFCAFMYDTGRAPPDNDAITSRLLNVQIQKYRKVMASLIRKGKIIRTQGILINERVQEELDKYRLDKIARSEAAKKREEERKERLQREIAKALEAKAKQDTPQATPQDTPPLTPMGTVGGQPWVPDEARHKKDNKINETQAGVWHGSGTNPESRIQNPESKQASSAPPELAGLNGSADPMLKDIVGWMVGGDEPAARSWLAKFIQLHGQEVVRESYFKLSTDIAQGALLARPLEVWGKIATRIRKEPRQGAPPQSSEDRLERIRGIAEAAVEKKRPEVRR